jgi:predicted lipoprotein with Yx(FWY)xxD motif
MRGLCFDPFITCDHPPHKPQRRCGGGHLADHGGKRDQRGSGPTGTRSTAHNRVTDGPERDETRAGCVMAIRWPQRLLARLRAHEAQWEVFMIRSPLTRSPLSLAFALALIAVPALADTTAILEKGGMLTDANGMTLYTYDMDKGGVSACYDACAANWPPLLAAADAKASDEYGLTDRKDGTKQWTYKDMPLYLWVKDAKPGDMTGDGVKGVWHVVKY